MGTDAAGLGIFSRVLHAPRIDLFIALVSTLRIPIRHVPPPKKGAQIISNQLCPNLPKSC